MESNSQDGPVRKKIINLEPGLAEGATTVDGREVLGEKTDTLFQTRLPGAHFKDSMRRPPDLSDDFPSYKEPEPMPEGQQRSTSGSRLTEANVTGNDSLED